MRNGKYNRASEWRAGLLAGLPICLGYLAVSFGVGILAVRAGMSIFQAALLSATNLTSAGQAAGIAIIGSGGSYLELALSQLVINFRYSLMGLSLTQRLTTDFGTPQRLIASYGITDEIFGVASGRYKKITPSYLFGMILISAAGWVTGTLLGAVAGETLPARFVAALGILLYAMFLALLLPPAKKSRPVLFVILASAGLHLLFHFGVPKLSDGFAVILCGVGVAALGALLFPVDDPEAENATSAPIGAKEREGRPE